MKQLFLIAFFVLILSFSTVAFAEITVFPSTPLSGDNFALIFDNSSFNGSGFLSLESKLIPVEIQNGFCILQVEQETFGDACLWVQGHGFIYNFTIESGLEGSAVFSLSKDVRLHSETEIRLSVSGSPLKRYPVFLTNPEGMKTEFTTDDSGKIYPVLDRVGTWKVEADYKKNKIVETITVDYLSLDVSVSKERFVVGEKVGIVTSEDYVELTIKKGNTVKIHTGLNDGYYEFTPDEYGSYSVVAVNNENTKKGQGSFIVKKQASIKIFDKRNMQTSILRQHDDYIVQIVDSNGDIITAYDEVDTPTGLISLNDGIGFWSPTLSGDIVLSLDDKEWYLGDEIILSVEGEQTQTGDDYTIYIILLFIVGGIVLVYFLHNQGVITLPDFKKIFNNMFKKEDVPDDLF